MYFTLHHNREEYALLRRHKREAIQERTSSVGEYQRWGELGPTKLKFMVCSMRLESLPLP